MNDEAFDKSVKGTKTSKRKGAWKPDWGEESFRLRREEDRNLQRGQLPSEEESGNGDQDVATVVYTVPVDHEGMSVYVKGWVKPDSPNPPLLIVHDLRQNIGLYRRFARKLLDNDCSVYGFDLRGHGRSGGKVLGHVPSFNVLVRDLLQVVAWVRYRSNRQMPVIVGHGIGALIAIYFQTMFPEYCPAAILSAPTITGDRCVPPWKQWIIKSMAVVAPRRELPQNMIPGFLNPLVEEKHDVSGVESALRAYRGISATFANELLTALHDAPQVFQAFDARTLILCPTQDIIFDYTSLRVMISRHRSQGEFDLREVEGGHYFLTDDDQLQDEAIAMIMSWLGDLQLREARS